MLKEKRPDIEIVGDELHPLLKVTDFSPYIAKIKASGRRQRHHRQLGAGHRASPQGRGGRRPAGELVHLLRRRRRRPDRDQADRPVAPRFRRSPKASPTPLLPEAQKWEAAFRAKEGVALYYPRAVNEMRMLAKAANEAKSTDRQSGRRKARRDEGRAVRRRRGLHAQGRPSVLPAHVHRSFGVQDPGAKFDEEGTGWGWKLVGAVKADETVLPTTCKMERP